jgi:hypothetical protein
MWRSAGHAGCRLAKPGNIAPAGAFQVYRRQGSAIIERLRDILVRLRFFCVCACVCLIIGAAQHYQSVYARLESIQSQPALESAFCAQVGTTAIIQPDEPESEWTE